MNDKLKQKIEEEILKLPKDWQEAVRSFNWGKSSEEIGKKYLLNESEINDLQIEVGLVLIGLEEQDSFTLNIENNVVLSKDEAEKMTEEINRIIFTPISEKLLSKKESVSTPTPISSKREEIITNYQLPITNGKEGVKTITKEKVDDEVPLPPYVNSSKEQVVSSKEEAPIETPIIINKPDEELKYISKNVFEDKMKASTASGHSVTDHSKPKIDPYREEF